MSFISVIIAPKYSRCVQNIRLFHVVPKTRTKMPLLHKTRKFNVFVNGLAVSNIAIRSFYYVIGYL